MSMRKKALVLFALGVLAAACLGEAVGGLCGAAHMPDMASAGLVSAAGMMAYGLSDWLACRACKGSGANPGGDCEQCPRAISTKNKGGKQR